MRRATVWVVLVVVASVAGSGCRLGGGGGAAVLSPGPESAAAAGPGAGSGAGAARLVDRARLGAALASAGIRLPAKSNVYAAILDRGGPTRRFDVYEAGGGARSADFWPASSIKLLAAVGALAYLKTLGFTGAASVRWAGTGAVPVRDLVRAAVVDSANDAYDDLVAIAGVDWLNDAFLTSQRGFPATVIQRSYVYAGVVPSPAMTITEGDRELALAARPSAGGFGVADGGNRSNLLELTESVRRVVLHGSLPPDERFPIDAIDALDLELALLAADGFLAPAAPASGGFLVFDKPGYVPGDDCVDVAYIEDLDRSRAYLLGVSTPDDGPECRTLTEVARGTLAFLAAQ